jgi:hypothetical protein
MQKLLIIEDQVKVEKKTHWQGQENNKHLKNPCRVHNGGHEWDNCRENPKNKNNKEKASHTDTDNQNNRGKGQWTSNHSSHEENRNAESRQRERDSSCERGRNGHRNDSSDEEYESNQMITKGSKETPSAEIIITIPKDKGGKQYKTYLGLVNTGTSSSLINRDIVKDSTFEKTLSKKGTLCWNI